MEEASGAGARAEDVGSSSGVLVRHCRAITYFCWQDYGHRVRLAAHANFKDFVMTTGLEFYPLGGDPKILAGYWGPKIDVVGFCFLDLASNYEPPEPLLRWLGSGDKPIYIGFGSLVHHGGAGTTAAGLKAACPTTIIPFFGDQFFWGSMVHARGLGAPPVPVEQLQLHSLVDAIKFMIDPKVNVKERAVELAKAIESEDGVDGAVQSFLKHLPQQRDPETPPAAPPSTFMNPLLLPVKRCFGIAS
nr:unnamed protein product [Digitaria exilis]